MPRRLLLGALLSCFLTTGVDAAGWGSFKALGLPQALGKPVLQNLLQSFVDLTYLKSFRHLGDERDFDHGHLLFSSGPKPQPVAILYHTQELALDETGEYAYIDAEGRNWLQWLKTGAIENANRYARRSYPRSARWALFEKLELPGLKRHRTLTGAMLDPDLLGVELSPDSFQWVFTRVACPAADEGAPDAALIGIRLPTKERVCLALSAS